MSLCKIETCSDARDDSRTWIRFTCKTRFWIQITCNPQTTMITDSRSHDVYVLSYIKFSLCFRIAIESLIVSSLMSHKLKLNHVFVQLGFQLVFFNQKVKKTNFVIFVLLYMDFGYFLSLMDSYIILK